MFLIYLTPVLTAAIGWFTNWVAIQMLFHPRKPRRLFGVTWQGLIPRRQISLAAEAADIIERELIQQHLILKEVRGFDLTPFLTKAAHSLVWDRIGPRLKAMPLMGHFVSDKILTNLETVALEEISREAGPIVEAVALQFEERFDIKKIVRENIAAFDLDQLESVVWAVARREFKTIEWMGAVLGGLVGVVQLVVILAFLR